MSAAPAHPARPPPPQPRSPTVARRLQRAAGSSRVQVVALAAARLRTLHLDALVNGSDVPFADQPSKKNGRLALLSRLKSPLSTLIRTLKRNPSLQMP